MLLGHSKDVLAAARAVLDAACVDQLRAVGLDAETWQPRMRRIVEIAAACHDLGKANDHFQYVISQVLPRKTQGVRHEWISVWLLALPEWRAWLGKAFADPRDLDLVEWAVAGHHPAHDRASPPTGIATGSKYEDITVLAGHADFHECCRWLATEFGIDSPPPSTNQTLTLLKSNRGYLFGQFTRWSVSAAQRWRSMVDEERRLVAIVKACLIGSDVAGPALPQTDLPPVRRWEWVSEAFHAVPDPDDLHMLVSARLANNEPREFQRLGAASEKRVTFVRAGCGTGKTLLAYMWARQQCPHRRLYICYPTTGTASEGFRGYLMDAEKHARFGAELFHSRASVDLDMLGVSDEEDDGLVRIDSLRAWSTPIVCCTVDTVLGLMQNQRRGLYAWPALAGAAFVFDEIHSYDASLWEALIRFLGDLRGVPVLLMTASLPARRLEALRTLLGGDMAEIPGPAELEELPRYHRMGERDAIEAAREEVCKGGKVLRVCNTVKGTLAFADSLADLAPPVYHSRFRYEDRVERHKEVIDAFEGAGPAIALCTQVAEMSLDLSATLLISDLAPVPALIQRLGRLNRRATKATDPPMPFLIVEPDGSLPYEDADLEAARQWLGALGVGAVSQADLARAWEGIADDRDDARRGCCWLDGGPQTQVAPTRDSSPGISVLMECDRARMRSGKDLVRLIVPMPPPNGTAWRNWSRWRGLPIAPMSAIDYDPKRGGEWRK
jgi:CRISPR-associated endonuclease/helicase Cas3